MIETGEQVYRISFFLSLPVFFFLRVSLRVLTLNNVFFKRVWYITINKNLTIKCCTQCVYTKRNKFMKSLYFIWLPLHRNSPHLLAVIVLLWCKFIGELFFHKYNFSACWKTFMNRSKRRSLAAYKVLFNRYIFSTNCCRILSYIHRKVIWMSPTQLGHTICFSLSQNYHIIFINQRYVWIVCTAIFNAYM